MLSRQESGMTRHPENAQYWINPASGTLMSVSVETIQD